MPRRPYLPSISICSSISGREIKEFDANSASVSSGQSFGLYNNWEVSRRTEDTDGVSPLQTA